MSYNVDIVMVIDITGSMHHMIDMVKDNALTFHQDLLDKMNTVQKDIGEMRIRVIGFRDYYADPEGTVMQMSDFFTLPADNGAFESFVKGLYADGGGDEPESGLEALTFAIKSTWDRKAVKSRHIIAFYADSSAHPFCPPGQSHPPHYPTDMPKDLKELTDLWSQNMDSSAKRLLLFSPDVEPWSTISDDWDNTIHFPSKAGEGLAETDYNAIIESIVNSI